MSDPSGQQRGLYGLERDAELRLPPGRPAGTELVPVFRFTLGMFAVSAFFTAIQALRFGGDWPRPLNLLSSAAGLLTLALGIDALGIYTGWVLWKVKTAPVTNLYRLWFSCMFGGSLCQLLGKLAMGRALWWFDWLLPVIAAFPLVTVLLEPE
jgi:hypothetical protein